MIEPDVIFVGKSVDALPRQVDALVAHGGHLLDAGPVGCDGVVADHAGAEAGNTGDRPFVDAFVTELAHHALADVRVVGKLDRLLCLGPPIQKVIDCRSKCGTSGCKHARRLAGKRRYWSRGSGRGLIRLNVPTRQARRQRSDAHRHEHDETRGDAQEDSPTQRPGVFGPRLRR
jgi:hypothetical protein